MPSVHDVAQYILEKGRPVTAMKLQKLAYYSQAWHIVWVGETLFDEEIKAWVLGPVVTELYELHRGKFLIDAWPTGDSTNLSAEQKESIDSVVDYYGKMNAQQLSDLTHSEAPWIDARKGLGPTERGEVVITPQALEEFYSALQ